MNIRQSKQLAGRLCQMFVARLENGNHTHSNMLQSTGFPSSHETFGTDLCTIPTLEGANNHPVPTQCEINSFGHHQECEGDGDSGLQGFSKTRSIYL